jgi:hypothetical protein
MQDPAISLNGWLTAGAPRLFDGNEAIVVASPP